MSLLNIHFGDPETKFVFPELKFCIYCGSRDRETSKLSSEHIFPLGLGGRIELPSSSCESCREITGSIEQKLLRGPFWPVRAKLGIHSGRRPKEQPVDFDVEFWKGHSQNRLMKKIKVQNEPVFLMLPAFKEPSILNSSDSNQDFGFSNIIISSFGDNSIIDDLNKTLEKNKMDGIGLGTPVDPILIMRFVAKILHGLTYAEIGENFKPYLADIITGKNIDDIGRFIGSYQGDFDLNIGTHHIGLGRYDSVGKELIVGGVSLFTKKTGLLYIAVVGEFL